MKKHIKYLSAIILFIVSILMIIGLFVDGTKIFYILAAILSGGLCLGMLIYIFVEKKINRDTKK